MFYNYKQQSDPELGNLQARELGTVCKMVLRGKYICNYELKNLSNGTLGFGAVSSCCWDSWGLCPSYGLPSFSSTQSSSQLSSCGQQLTLATGCLLTGEAAPEQSASLPYTGEAVSEEEREKLGTPPSNGDADPACRAMG